MIKNNSCHFEQNLKASINQVLENKACGRGGSKSLKVKVSIRMWKKRDQTWQVSKRSFCKGTMSCWFQGFEVTLAILVGDYPKGKSDSNNHSKSLLNSICGHSTHWSTHGHYLITHLVHNSKSRILKWIGCSGLYGSQMRVDWCISKYIKCLCLARQWYFCTF